MQLYVLVEIHIHVYSYCCVGFSFHFRPMSHLRFYRAILSRNFIARQSCTIKSQVWHRSYAFATRQCRRRR